MMEIKIFNVGRGSAVLVELPTTTKDVRVGVVDCFAGINNEQPLLRRLEELDRQSAGNLIIEFFVLTHMHADHFLGAAEILRRFKKRVKRFFDPGIDPRKVMVADFNTRTIYDTRAQRELTYIARFRDQYKHKVIPLTSRGISIYSDSENAVAVKSVAPEGSMLSKVERVLESFVSDLRNTSLSDEIPPVKSAYDLNKTSSAVEISCRGKRIILGGDVLTSSWDTLFREVEGSEAPCDVFLLSHHGASNAFPQKIWPMIHRENGYIAVSGKGRGQPAASVLSFLLKNSTGGIWMTNIPDSHRPITTLHEYVIGVHYGSKVSSSTMAGDVSCVVDGDVNLLGPRIS